MENNIDSIFNNVASKKINYYRLKKGYSLGGIVNYKFVFVGIIICFKL